MPLTCRSRFLWSLRQPSPRISPADGLDPELRSCLWGEVPIRERSWIRGWIDLFLSGVVTVGLDPVSIGVEGCRWFAPCRIVSPSFETWEGQEGAKGHHLVQAPHVGAACFISVSHDTSARRPVLAFPGSRHRSDQPRRRGNVLALGCGIRPRRVPDRTPACQGPWDDAAQTWASGAETPERVAGWVLVACGHAPSGVGPVRCGRSGGCRGRGRRDGG